MQVQVSDGAGNTCMYTVTESVVCRWYQINEYIKQVDKLKQKCPSKCQVGECMMVEIHIKRTVPWLMTAAGLHKVSL